MPQCQNWADKLIRTSTSNHYVAVQEISTLGTLGERVAFGMSNTRLNRAATPAELVAYSRLG